MPLAVWPCAQTTGPRQRASHYLPASARHPAKMLPALAQRILVAFSRPGDLVVDPMCGIGTTLVEAALLGRRCVGVELEPRWAAHAAANLDHALPTDRRPLATLRTGDARHLPALLGHLVGQVDLVVTSPPYAAGAQAIDKPAWLAGHSLGVPDTRDYSADPSNIGRARAGAYATAMSQVYAGCLRLLRPGGLLVAVTKNSRQAGRLTNLAGLTVALATTAGFTYTGHIIALHAAVRDDRLVWRPTLWQLLNLGRAHAAGLPAHLVVHEDISVFTKPPHPNQPDGDTATPPGDTDDRQRS